MEQAGTKGVPALGEGRMPSFPTCRLRVSAVVPAVNTPRRCPRSREIRPVLALARLFERLFLRHQHLLDTAGRKVQHTVEFAAQKSV